jgi:hypothetical protein
LTNKIEVKEGDIIYQSSAHKLSKDTNYVGFHSYLVK